MVEDSPNLDHLVELIADRDQVDRDQVRQRLYTTLVNDPYAHGFARQRLYTALSGANNPVPDTETLIKLASEAAALIESYRVADRNPR